MAKILLAGCGDIGSRLAEILNRQGHHVVGLRRNPPFSSNGSIDYYKADLTQAEDLVNLDADFDHIFFLPAPDHRDIQAYQAVYRTGLGNLLSRFATQSHRPRWFLVSSTSVYGQSKGEWVDEMSPVEPTTETGKVIYQAEQRVLAADPNNVVVRFSGIYGPGRDRLVKMAAQKPSIQFDPPYYSNRIHQDDCAAVLAFLLAQRLAGRRLESCCLASDDEPAPLSEVMSWLAEQLKCPPPLPKTLNYPVPDQNKRCRNSRLKTLGYRFIYPSYKDGYRPLVAGKR